MSRVAFLLGVAAGWLVYVPTGSAELDPEFKKPYHFRIVLRVAPHPQLTSVFKERLQRELHDIWQGALGDMAEVVVLHQHPLLNDIEAKGLQQALESCKEPRDRKTHFVLVELTAEEKYRIQTGQFDSTTGLASPVVRRAGEEDREFVARTASRLIQPDFGFVGTVMDRPINPDRVRVAIKGSKLGGRLDRWVKKDDIFAVTQVWQAGAGERLSRLPGVLLQVNEDPRQAEEGREGVIYCRWHQRYQNSSVPRPGVLGFRCLKLGTTQAPLRLRFVNEKTLAPVDGLEVRVNPFGLGERDGVKLQGTTNADGFLQGPKAPPVYEHVAFVRVFKNHLPLAQFPVEILDDRPITCRVPGESRAGPVGELQERAKRLLKQINETLDVHRNLNKELNVEFRKQQEPALARAQKALQGLDNDINNFKEERLSIRETAHNMEEFKRKEFDLSAVEQGLKELLSQQERLNRFISDLDAAQRASGVRKQLLRKLADARLMEDQADFKGAIALYLEVEAKKNALEENEYSQIAQYRQKLEEMWRIKDKDHQAARTFIYEKWATLEEPRDVKENLEQAEAAFNKCCAVGDRLTLLKLKLANDAIALRLKERLESLRTDISEDDLRVAKTIQEIADPLEKLQKAVLVFLKPAGKPSGR